MSKWIVLDRDGVINYDSSRYIKSASEWQPIPGSLDAIKMLSEGGFRIAVVTNQAGVGRGIFSLRDLLGIHSKLNRSLAAMQVRLDGIFVCLHSPEANCHCRKPKVGMLEHIQREFGTNLTGCPFVGDSLKDLHAATDFSMSPVLVKTGKGMSTLQQLAEENVLKDVQVYDNLNEFTKSYLKNQVTQAQS